MPDPSNYNNDIFKILYCAPWPTKYTAIYVTFEGQN